jgi:hypothetical protein
VGHRIRIGVPGKALVKGNDLAAEDQGPALNKPM